MSRWEPDAPGRLLHAALELFLDQGYEATSAAQIAERAGLTKTTLFRLFADKREVLFQGQPAAIALVRAGVESAPDGATAVETMRAGLLALCEAHVPAQQEIGRQVETLIATSPELQERAMYKRATTTVALEQALTARTHEARLAGVLADVGMRAYYDGFSRWILPQQHSTLAEIVRDELDALVAAVSQVRG